MHRYLVVANLTLGGPHLMAVLRDRVARGPCEVHVLVPAGPDIEGGAHDEATDIAHARDRLDEAMKRFTDLGCAVTGETADPRPVDAVRDALAESDYDEVIISTLPAGISRWLRLDLVSRLERAVDIPVTHVEMADDSA